jgi:hypothetical protein
MLTIALFFLLTRPGQSLVHLTHHRISSSSSSSTEPQSHSHLRHLRASSPPQHGPAHHHRDPYSTYYPAAITESFIQEHRCKLLTPTKKSREIPLVEQHDELFREMLELYDGNNRLHQKQMFMGTRIGQFPFDLQVITEVSISSSLTLLSFVSVSLCLCLSSLSLSLSLSLPQLATLSPYCIRSFLTPLLSPLLVSASL